MITEEIIARGMELNVMKTKRITLEVKVELDEDWSSGLTEEEIAEFIRSKYDTSLGYRAAIKKFEVVKETK